MDIRVSAYGLIIDDGRVLLTHLSRDERSRWTLPGGGIDPDEDPADAARREITEETGYVAELQGLLGVDSLVIPVEERGAGTGPWHALRIIYLAKVIGGALHNESDGSTDEAAWFALGDVAALDTVELVDNAFAMRDLS